MGKGLVSIALVLVAALAAAQEQSVPAQELMPLEARSRPFLITHGPNEGQRVQVALEPTTDQTASWRLRMEEVGDIYLIERPSGGLAITRMELRVKQQRIIYQEPVRLLPAMVAPDTSHTAQTHAQVIDLEEDIVREGEVTHRLSPVRRATLQLPAGTMQAFLVEAEQTIELDWATVTLRLEGGFAQGEGLIYGYVRYDVDKPLFFGSTTIQTVELAEQP